MIIEKPRPNAFCETVLAWRHEDGTESAITEVYVGPEEYSSAGPFFGHDFDWVLDSGDPLKVVVRCWKTRSGYPDTENERDYHSRTTYVSTDHGRSWREEHGG